jgi:replicative DNA helicase
MLGKAERLIAFQIAEARPKSGGPVGINDILVKAIDCIDDLFSNGDAITGLSTRFSDGRPNQWPAAGDLKLLVAGRRP